MQDPFTFTHFPLTNLYPVMQSVQRLSYVAIKQKSSILVSETQLFVSLIKVYPVEHKTHTSSMKWEHFIDGRFYIQSALNPLELSTRLIVTSGF